MVRIKFTAPDLPRRDVVTVRGRNFTSADIDRFLEEFVELELIKTIVRDCLFDAVVYGL